MERLKQIGYILGILLISEVLEKGLNLPLPGAILGMMILTLLLALNIISVDKIEDGAGILIGLLSFFFVPTLVGAKDSIGHLKGNVIKVVAIVIIATFVVLIVTSLVVQTLNRKMDGKRGDNNGYK